MDGRDSQEGRGDKPDRRTKQACAQSIKDKNGEGAGDGDHAARYQIRVIDLERKVCEQVVQRRVLVRAAHQ